MSSSVPLRPAGHFSPGRSSLEQPRDILIHDERHARPRQDTDEVGCQTTVERSYASFGICPFGASGNVGIQVCCGVVLFGVTVMVKRNVSVGCLGTRIRIAGGVYALGFALG